MAGGIAIFDQIPQFDRIPIDIRLAVSRFLIAVAVVIILWLLRHFVTALIVNPIRKRIQETDTQTDDAIFRAVDGSISWLVLGFGIFVGTFILGLSAEAQQIGVQLAFSLIIVAVIKALYELATYVTRTPSRIHKVLRLNVDRPLIPIARVVSQVLVLIVGIFTVANVWGVNLTGLLTGLGIGGLAISLAAKEVLDDVLGYMVIMSDDVYNLDEYIVSPHAEGIIEHIGIRSTRIRRLDQGLAIIPNSVIVSEEIVNWSRLERRWFNFMLGLQYNTPVEKIEKFAEAVRDMLKGREAVDPDSVVVLFTQYDDSSLNLLVRSYVDIEDWTASKEERHAVNLEIAHIADELDVSMAFPSRSLYLEKMPAGLTRSENGGTGDGFNRVKTHETVGAREYVNSDQNDDVDDFGGQEGDGHSEEAE